ncbi:hypothetical protein [Nannocystis radixulma]|uniref:Glyoxalase n=1 Tax=Nannocystis radixulma TaxID=2995305 RepID=A0ABT5BQH2_9BACT|nr:hypothetical protein [Nannocystis radixulma]MDC0675653.1 hypothetical protein [Nannocystis radixulma]
MHPETMIPVLPTVSLTDTFAFYRLLGFEVTYEQTRPYVYASVRRGGMEVHFMGIKELDPKDAYSTCLVMVPEVEQLHATFAGALRSGYGKLPIAGIPRITRMKPGQTRFTVVDVAGNSLIFIKHDAGGSEDEDPLEAVKRRPDESRLAHAVRFAARLRDFKNDDAAAAKVLDLALARPEPGDPLERARALSARIELAVAHSDPTRAEALRAELAALPLSAEQRAELAAELGRTRELERSQE